MGGSKGSNSNSDSQVGNQNAGGGKSSNVAASGVGANAAGTMKAPGRGDTIYRESFESNPAAYFKDLRK
ncbi:hypothetical protein L3X38_005823 [Prunus dulcis]|uniref:Uncharacterized protein n=1 Tax=Prunus dulcis TaxID=3755 RepID=A0AAD4ZRL4_PRUDU|nr:hypothetical protein L3X38_005823 [Prunus dulcis]